MTHLDAAQIHQRRWWALRWWVLRWSARQQQVKTERRRPGQVLPLRRGMPEWWWRAPSMGSPPCRWIRPV